MEKKPKSVTQRVEEYEARLLEKGGRKLSAIRLVPEAAAALAFFEQRGESAPKVINRLLIAAREQEE
jgi:hypothetical protein